MLDIQKTIEVAESFVNEGLLNTERAWSQPIDVVEMYGRKYEIRLQSTLIEDEYGKIDNKP